MAALAALAAALSPITVGEEVGEPRTPGRLTLPLGRGGMSKPGLGGGGGGEEEKEEDEVEEEEGVLEGGAGAGAGA